MFGVSKADLFEAAIAAWILRVPRVTAICGGDDNATVTHRPAMAGIGEGDGIKPVGPTVRAVRVLRTPSGTAVGGGQDCAVLAYHSAVGRICEGNGLELGSRA